MEPYDLLLEAAFSLNEAPSYTKGMCVSQASTRSRGLATLTHSIIKQPPYTASQCLMLCNRQEDVNIDLIPRDVDTLE